MAQKKNTKTSKAKKTKEVVDEGAEVETVEKPSKTACNISFGNRWN